MKPPSAAGATSGQPAPTRKESPRLEIFDPAMCCSTGVCGPDVDPKLVHFSADVKWLRDQGVDVRRHNLAQNPMAFVENEQVKAVLSEKGEAALPLMLIDGRVLASGHYPPRAQLADALGLNGGERSLFTPSVKELAAIAAAIAANCEPCLKYHYRQAQLMGVSKADMASAVKTGAAVKDSPHQAILRLADKLTGTGLSDPAAASDPCCGTSDSAGAEPTGQCCG